MGTDAAKLLRRAEERNPIEPLAQLAALYHANVYNAQAVQPLAALRRLS